MNNFTKLVRDLLNDLIEDFYCFKLCFLLKYYTATNAIFIPLGRRLRRTHMFRPVRRILHICSLDNWKGIENVWREYSALAEDGKISLSEKEAHDIVDNFELAKEQIQIGTKMLKYRNY